MNKMGKKLTALLLTGVMAGTLGACTNGGEKESDASKPGEKEKIVIMHMNTEESIKQGNVEAIAMRQSIDNFKEKHPEIEVVEDIISQEAGYETKIKTLAAANELPDVFQALPSMMSSFYDNDLVEDLGPMLDKNPEWSDSFAEGAFGDFTFGEKILGVPRCGIANHVLYWNTEIFKECGMDTFPANADEFKTAVTTLKEKGYIPMACGNKGKYAIASQVMPGILFKFVDSEWYESLKNYEGASFLDEAPMEAITYMEELMKAGMFNEDVNSLDPIQARQLYYEEKAAMYVEGSWSISNYIAEASQEVLDKTDMTLFPPVSGKENLKNQIIGGQGWGMSMSKGLSEEKQDLIAEFFQEMTSPKIQGVLVEGGSLAVTKEASYDESKLNPFYKEFLDMYNSYDKIVGCPEVQLSTAYMDASYTGYQEMSVGAVDAKGLAEKLQQAHESAKK